jgi:hypothetical protein
MKALVLVALLLAAAPARADWKIEGQPLPDWIQRETGTASHLDGMCGDLAVEILLSGRSGSNHANVWLANAGDQPVTLLSDTVMARFSGGMVRRLLPASQGDRTTGPGFISGTVFAFPSKADFAGQSALSIEAEILRGGDRCTLRTSFRRDERIPEDPFTATIHQRMTLDLSLGAAFAHHGAIGRLTPPAVVIFGVGGTVVPWVHHGFTIDVLAGEWGHRGVAAVAPQSTESGTHLTPAIFLFGYAHRRYPLPWLVTSLEPSAGIYVLQLANGSSELQTSDVRLAARGRLRLQIPFGIWFASAAVDYYRFVGGSLGGARLGGGAIAAMVLAGFGE